MTFQFSAADENNKPANYSETNRPYKPKYVVPVSLTGVKEGDYSMTVGYPGSTSALYVFMGNKTKSGIGK